MVVYCLGSPEAKRARLKCAEKESGTMCLDNAEVIYTFREGGDTYFALGDIPFKELSVAEYVAYERSLGPNPVVGEREIGYYTRLFSFALRPGTKLGRLDAVRFRMAQLLAAYDLSVRRAYVNFDGMLYSRRAAKRLDAFIRGAGKYMDLYVYVSDYRFLPAGATVRYYSTGGQVCEISTSGCTCRRGRVRAVRPLPDEITSAGLRARKVVIASV